MNKKIFINIFFDNKKILFMFIIIFTTVIFYSGLQNVFLSLNADQAVIPDFEIDGKLGDDGNFRFRMYSDIDGLSEEVQQIVGEDIQTYDLTVRNLLYIEDARTFQKIHYLIYGVEDKFLDDELKGFLKEGELPKKGAKEALLGCFAARYYKVGVGDVIDVPITLNKELNDGDKGQYIVSGILNDNVDYFKGGIFISKETFESNNEVVEANQMVAYFKSSKAIKAYDEFSGEYFKLHDKYDTGNISVFFEMKNNALKNKYFSSIIVLLISITILFLLISYLMKGMNKKIGLLKALGLSDRYIMKVFMGGLGLCLTFSTLLAITGIHITINYLNKGISKFLGYDVEQYIVTSEIYYLTLGLTIVLFLTIYIIIKIKSTRIEPRNSMLKL